MDRIRLRNLNYWWICSWRERWYRKKDCLSAWDWVAWQFGEDGYVRGYWQFGRRSERNEKLKELRAWIEVHGLQGEVFFLELLHLPGNEIQGHKRVNVAKKYWESIEIGHCGGV